MFNKLQAPINLINQVGTVPHYFMVFYIICCMSAGKVLLVYSVLLIIQTSIFGNGHLLLKVGKIVAPINVSVSNL